MPPTPVFTPQTRAERIAWVQQQFQEAFPGSQPTLIVRAPGRVNLIGEHTDYNGGFVFPMAIDRDILMAGRRSTPPSVTESGRSEPITLYAVDYQQRASLPMEELEVERGRRSPGQPGWARYIYGVIWALQRAGFPVGPIQAVFSGNIPQGAGLSSSAALEVATATLLEHLYGLQIDGPHLAKLCQTAENQYVGMNCGIMDQFISRLGRRQTALLLDCRSLEYEWVPLPADEVAWVVCNTAVRRGLVDSAFNQRRAECEEAVALLRRQDPRVTELRDVTPEQLAAARPSLPEVIARRATHVVAENERVWRMVEALRSRDWAQAGELLNASHTSLKELYEVSSPALDLMVELARQVPGVYGARMTGAGFGGCTINLVSREAVPEFLSTVIPAYLRQSPEPLSGEPEAYACQADEGAGVLKELKER